MTGLVDLVHAPGVNKNQDNKGIDRTLLGEPEPQFETVNMKLVKIVDPKNAATKRHHKPDRQQARHEPQVGVPIGMVCVFFLVVLRHDNFPVFAV
jgi:hypothetical protein